MEAHPVVLMLRFLWMKNMRRYMAYKHWDMTYIYIYNHSFHCCSYLHSLIISYIYIYIVGPFLNHTNSYWHEHIKHDQQHPINQKKHGHLKVLKAVLLVKYHVRKDFLMLIMWQCVKTLVPSEPQNSYGKSPCFMGKLTKNGHFQ